MYFNVLQPVLMLCLMNWKGIKVRRQVSGLRRRGKDLPGMVATNWEQPSVPFVTSQRPKQFLPQQFRLNLGIQS